jgi:outer membrane murein-binding lipoprotein Lpp
MMKPMPKPLTLCAILFIPCLMSGCAKKAQLEAEVAQLQNAANEQNALLKTVQAESAAIGNLGHYNYPQQSHLDQLRGRIKQLREETVSLTTEKEIAAKDIELLQRELDDYRARHLQ